MSISDGRPADQSVTARQWLATFAATLGIDAPEDARNDEHPAG